MMVAAIGQQKVTCICVFDILAAFDAIDHDILLKVKRLSAWFGISNKALSRFRSYLSFRFYSVKAAGNVSQPLPSPYKTEVLRLCFRPISDLMQSADYRSINYMPIINYQLSIFKVLLFVTKILSNDLLKLLSMALCFNAT